MNSVLDSGFRENDVQRRRVQLWFARKDGGTGVRHLLRRIEFPAIPILPKST